LQASPRGFQISSGGRPLRQAMLSPGPRRGAQVIIGMPKVNYVAQTCIVLVT